MPGINDLIIAGRQHEDARLRDTGFLIVQDRADQVPGCGIDPARKRPATGEAIAAIDPAGAAAREDQRRADQVVGRLAPDLVLRLFRPHPEQPVMRREVGQHPGGRAAAAADHRHQLDDRAERQFAAADPLRLEDAEQPGAMQILDRLIGHAAQFLGLGGALAQNRHQRLGALQQLREIRRPTGPAPLWATLSRLGHPTPLLSPSTASPGWAATPLYPRR